MSVLSKILPPLSLFEMCICVVSEALMLKFDPKLLKRDRFSSSFYKLNDVVSRVREDVNLAVYPHQEKDNLLVSKDSFNSNECQRFNYRKGLKFSSLLRAYGILLIAIAKYSQEFQADAVQMALILLKSFLAVLSTLKLTISGPLVLRRALKPRVVKNVGQFRKLPRIIDLSYFPMLVNIILAKDFIYLEESFETLWFLNIFCLQVPRKIQKTVGLEHINHSVEKPAILDGFYLQMSLGNKYPELLPETPDTMLPKLSETPVSMTPDKTEPLSLNLADEIKEMKLLGMCFSCKEKISEKKFFDERRFGVLKKCDCMICYGCLRKVALTSGVVKGPVECPSCSLESDQVVASARWIEGEEKTNVFDSLPKLPETLASVELECMDMDTRSSKMLRPRPSFRSDTIDASNQMTIEGIPQSSDGLQEYKAPKMKSGSTLYRCENYGINASVSRMGLVN